MKSDHELQAEVRAELAADTRVNGNESGVIAKDAAITLAIRRVLLAGGLTQQPQQTAWARAARASLATRAYRTAHRR